MDRPECPEHPRSSVVRAGWYGRAPHRRQRWWCRPIDGFQPHRFTPVLPRVETLSRECSSCHTRLEVWEGRPAPREYTFAAETIARALVQVGAGASYRSASEAARRHAARWRHVQLPARAPGGPVLVDPMRHGQLVADWVEVYAPTLFDELGPKEWPGRMVADGKPVHDGAVGGQYGRGLFSVLGVVGWDVFGAMKVVRLEVHPRETGAAWRQFFSALPGVPAYICTDGGQAVQNGIRLAFGGAPDVRRCEYHLKKNMLKLIPASSPQSLLDRADKALSTPQLWTEFRSELDALDGRKHSLAAAQKWAKTNEPLIVHQAATRSPLTPNSVGPIEQRLTELDRSIAVPGRATGFRNAERTNRLLKLITLHMNKAANEQTYADILLRELLAAGGTIGRPQRGIVDRFGLHTLR